MQRRAFLLFSILLVVTKGFTKDKNSNELYILKSVLDHLFPTNNRFNGAKRFGAIEYLLFIYKHPSFEKSDFDYLIEGSKELLSRERNFILLSKEKKEKALREFEQTRYGQNWLSFLMYYSLEAMLGDPIYKGNKNMSGWKNFNHTPPIPLTKTPFGKNYDL